MGMARQASPRGAICTGQHSEPERLSLQQMPGQALQGLVFALLISFCSYRFHLLTISGAVSQFMLGWTVFGIGGWVWKVPMVVFFLTSSLLSKLKCRRRKVTPGRSEEDSARNAFQVFANGGIPALLVLWNAFIPYPLLYPAYIGSLTAATADTWGTELGIRFGLSPKLVPSFKQVDARRSGGVTIAGTIGGIAGASMVALASLPWHRDGIVPHIGACIVAGAIGSLADSLFGATLQARYHCVVCGTISDNSSHCGRRSDLEGDLTG